MQRKVRGTLVVAAIALALGDAIGGCELLGDTADLKDRAPDGSEGIGAEASGADTSGDVLPGGDSSSDGALAEDAGVDGTLPQDASTDSSLPPADARNESSDSGTGAPAGYVQLQLCTMLTANLGANWERNLIASPGTWSFSYMHEIQNDCRVAGIASMVFGCTGSLFQSHGTGFTTAFFGCPTGPTDAALVTFEALLPSDCTGAPLNHVYTRADLNLLAGYYVTSVLTALGIAGDGGVEGGAGLTSAQILQIRDNLTALENQVAGVNPSTTQYTWSTCGGDASGE
jgi:hypothetical protein